MKLPRDLSGKELANALKSLGYLPVGELYFLTSVTVAAV